MEILGVVLNILKVVFGLGFVIFLHELGHFLAAKWNGVKVERFFLGFDPFGLRVFSFQHGETVYGIGAIPLGGYVKMLGEDPTEEGGQKSTDPRALGNKSIGARIVILSAGVATNLVLGLVLFTVTFMLGVVEIPARIGAVQAGSPAYEAGLRDGDEIVTIDGRGGVNFSRLTMKGSLSAAGQKLRLGVRRPGVDGILTIEVAPKRQDKADRPTIGILIADSLGLYDKKPFSPPPGLDGPPPKFEGLAEDSRVVDAGPVGGPSTPVADIFALDRVLAENRDRPVEIGIETPGEKGSSPRRTRATLPVSRFITLGLRMTPGPLASIQAGSIAEKAGFQLGDRVVTVDGRDDFDPMRLPDDLYARAGKPVGFGVERKVGGKTQVVDLSATPDGSTPWTEPVLGETEPLKLPGLGMAIEVEPRVAGVTPGGPADKAGIRPGALLRELIVPADRDNKDDRKGKPYRFAFAKAADKDVDEVGWPGAFWQLQVRPIDEVKLVVDGTRDPIAVRPAPDPSWSSPRRGLNFLREIREVPPQPLDAAIRRGWDDTYDNIVSIYAMIRSLFQGRVSRKNLAGLPRIAGIAYQTASMGLVPLLQFLGMLSINLAVLNFLPIPPLDGGQIAFLLAEKVRGKPLPDSTLNVMMIGGLVLVGLLMLFTILQDVWILVVG